MENYSFKTVAFGGFDKQDVVRYLEQAAEKNAALQRAHEEESEKLRGELEELREQVEQLQNQIGKLNVQRDWLQNQLETETTAREGLESLRSLEQDVARLTAEANALRPDAEAYARFRERLGAIECEARNRADDLEEAAAGQTRRTAEAFQREYRNLMDLFRSAAGHVTQELQGIQDALAQLPQSMEPTETGLNTLISKLQKGTELQAACQAEPCGEAEPEEAEPCREELHQEEAAPEEKTPEEPDVLPEEGEAAPAAETPSFF
ncbi:MAG: hypothetical protein HFG04_02625 [Oscillibacter sp.]|nr:hypothetical protein [Oscillibacter sp.]